MNIKALIVMFNVICLTGCASGVNAIDAAVPTAAVETPPDQYTREVAQEQLPEVQQRPEVASQPADQAALQVAPDTAGPRDTGTYPNINDEPLPSTNQIGNAERQKLMAQMVQLRNQHAAGRVSAQQYQTRLLYLQRLARTHDAETQRRIAGQ